MSVKAWEKYQPNASSPSPQYPYGSLRQETALGVGDGTPLDVEWGNDFEAFKQTAFSRSGLVPSGNTDTVTNSEMFNAMQDSATRSLWERSAAESGYNLVAGSFEEGGTLVNANDVLWSKKLNKIFSGSTGTVVAGTDPASGGFVDVSMAISRPLTYEDFRLSSGLFSVTILGARFERTGSMTYGATPTTSGGELFIYDSDGVQFKHIREGRVFIAESIGIDNIQVASNYLSSIGGGILQWSTNFEFNDSFVVGKGVTLYCDNRSEAKLITSTAKNYACIYLRDDAYMIGGRVNGGGKLYIKTTSPDKEFFNKVGITTQGATIGKGQRVFDVGFTALTNSCLFVFDNHHDFEAAGCYTYGNMYGRYVEIDENNNVVNHNAGKDPVKLANGTMGYCLLNFYNSGSGAHDVSIYNNRGVDNITDSFAAPNDAAYDHKIYGNTSKKTAAGYYGGYGVDFNNCDRSKSWGNTFVGFSVGAHFYRGGKHNRAFGNNYETAVGTFFEATSPSNRSNDNTVRLSSFGSQADLDNGFRALSASCGVIVSETLRTVCRDSISSVNASTTPITGSVLSYSAGSFGQIAVETTAPHGLRDWALCELSGCGSLDGIWRVNYISPTKFDLIGSVYTGEVIPAGTFYNSRAGVACIRNNANIASQVWSESDFEDIGVGLWVGASSSSIISGADDVYVNVPQPTRGGGAYTNNNTLISGLSSTGTRCRNFVGQVSCPANSTQVTVTFPRAETDANYKVMSLTPISANNNPYIISKSTTGFVIGYDSKPSIIPIDWMISR